MGEVYTSPLIKNICNCGTGTIGGIESGKAKPSFEMMIKISEALNINPADLFIRDASQSKEFYPQQRNPLTQNKNWFIIIL